MNRIKMSTHVKFGKQLQEIRDTLIVAPGRVPARKDWMKYTKMQKLCDELRSGLEDIMCYEHPETVRKEQHSGVRYTQIYIRGGPSMEKNWEQAR